MQIVILLFSFEVRMETDKRWVRSFEFVRILEKEKNGGGGNLILASETDWDL